MIDFLKRLFHDREKDVTFLLFDGDAPESSGSFQFKPKRLLWLLTVSVGVVVGGVLVLIMFTPLGMVLYDRSDAMLRDRVIEVSQKVQALQDSLQHRDAQLTEMQRVITTGDSSFQLSNEYQEAVASENRDSWELNLSSEVQPIPKVSSNEIIFSETFQNIPDFPADYPVEGTFTREFNSENGHHGVDIATQEGTPFKTVADGVIINQEWTVNYGYVLHVQHNGGFITIYKHATTLAKTIGDVVLRGEILGTAGDTGVLSTGSHLHVEIWKNGVPQNPNMYLIKS